MNNEIDLALVNINYIGLQQQISKMLEEHQLLIGTAKDISFNDSLLIENLIKLVISGCRQ